MQLYAILRRKRRRSPAQGAQAAERTTLVTDELAPEEPSWLSSYLLAEGSLWSDTATVSHDSVASQEGRA